MGLYDNWKMFDLWSLEEAACLLNGSDPKAAVRYVSNPIVPTSTLEFTNERIKNAHQIALRSIDAGMLKPINAETRHYFQRYQVRPADFIRWAIDKGLSVPEELRELALMAERLPANSKSNNRRSEVQRERHAAKREEVLGAALALLATFPEHCKDQQGHVRASKLANFIDEKSGLFWPETSEAPLQFRPMARLLRTWLKKTQ